MKILKQSIILTIVMFIICGIVYPYFVTGAANLFFKDKAQGSIVYINGKAVGSEFIGQKFEKPEYLHGRPSVFDYNVYNEKPSENVLPASGGTNLGNSNPVFSENTKKYVKKIMEENPAAKNITSELVTSSGSNLDPHISLQGALLQADRIAEARGTSKEKILKVIKDNSHNDIINVLKTNIALDNMD